LVEESPKEAVVGRDLEVVLAAALEQEPREQPAAVELVFVLEPMWSQEQARAVQENGCVRSPPKLALAEPVVAAEVPQLGHW
jgi:hypothetical protein